MNWISAAGFSLWGKWSECSKTCSSLNQTGTQRRNRTCINVKLGCEGSINETRECNNQTCPGEQSPFRRYNRDLTIRQRRGCLWKPRWKIDSASFQIISQLSQLAQLLKRREFMLELKRGGRNGVQIEMVEFIALPFSSSKKLKIWSFYVVVVQGRAAKKCTKKRHARAELLFC